MDGGAIYFDLFKPIGVNSNYFDSNNASYGPDIATFGFKLK